MVRLNCTPQDAETLWPPDDPSWAAEDVIESINAARRRMRVPFYIHELPGLRSVEDELARLVACGALAQSLRATGELAKETDVWKRLASAADVEPALRLHALHGAAACALDSGDAAAAPLHGRARVGRPPPPSARPAKEFEL